MDVGTKLQVCMCALVQLKSNCERLKDGSESGEAAKLSRQVQANVLFSEFREIENESQSERERRSGSGSGSKSFKFVCVCVCDCADVFNCGREKKKRIIIKNKFEINLNRATLNQMSFSRVLASFTLAASFMSN